MGDHENTVLVTTVAGLILVFIYLCPWRLDSGEFRWSPIYQKPMTYQKTYNPSYGTREGSRIESEDAEIAYGILVMELIAVAAAGAVMYRMTKSDEESGFRESDLE